MSEERVLRRQYANRQKGLLRQIGGRLFLTNQRMVFMPNRIDAATGGASWSRAFSEIVTIAVEPARLAPPVPGMFASVRRRLRVEDTDGNVELFVVNKVADTVRVFRTAMEGL